MTALGPSRKQIHTACPSVPGTFPGAASSGLVRAVAAVGASFLTPTDAPSHRVALASSPHVDPGSFPPLVAVNGTAVNAGT